MLLATSCRCSGGNDAPSSEDTSLQKLSSEILSSDPACWAKNSSSLTPRLPTSARSALEMTAAFASEMVRQAFSAWDTFARHVLWAASILPVSLRSSLCASCSGPLTTLPSTSSFSFRESRASLMISAADVCTVFASAKVEAGVPNASSSSPSSAVNGRTTSSSRLPAASTASILALAKLRMASASLRSLASRYAFFSASSFWEYSFLEAATLAIIFSIPL
mmetsp:Transcript_9251/g.24746  ORF Transcript_9251/g.24746 Transcript_9251/m.24746 type:complete len:221 (-) Transcript_9251:1430-2092(-)